MGRGRKSLTKGAQGNATSAPLKSSPDKISEHNLTPYQGKHRALGFFWCEECDEEWTSSSSWANTYQMCLTCNTAVYPYKQVSKPEQLTPYQGEHRAFGHYHCSWCEVEWASANSWANTYQKCKTCNTAVYPYKQYKLKRRKGSRKRKPHPMKLCQRCIETGLPCWEEEEEDYP